MFSKAVTFTLSSLVLIVHATAAQDPDLGDHPRFAHAMQVETRSIDDFPVVFHYGQVRPDFEDDAENPHRSRVSLDGEWQFRFDPKSRGTSEQWFATETDLSDWKKVQVPHCWDAMPGGKFWDWNDQSSSNPPHYNGAAWYRRSFELQPKTNKRQRIAFLGVQQRARVFLNGKEIAQHEGGGAPFSIDVTEHLKSGGNTLALKVVRLPNFKKKKNGKGWDELEYTHTLHPKAPDCWPYAGIHRSVSLIEEPALSIRKTQIHNKNGSIRHAVVVSNHGKADATTRVSVKTNIPDTKTIVSGPIQLAAGQTRVVPITLPAGDQAKPWLPDSPVVYQSTATLLDNQRQATDQLTSTFGIREFRTRGSQFVLNGKPIFLKGASVYGEHHSRGAALTKKDHQELFGLLHDSKSNFARLHVIQRDPYAYQLADQQGILVCGEWGGFWYKEKSMHAQTVDPQSIYQTMGRCAVWDLMNHPSVVLWGLNNECHQFCKEYEPFLKTSRDLVQEIDRFQQLPITWAAWHPHKGQPHFEHADAVGFNEYRGAMDPFELLDPDMKKVRKQNPNKPLIILENGAWSKRGSRGSVTKKNNENWQADLLKRQWEVLTKHSPAFAGYTYWLLTDYRSRKPYTGNKGQNGYSRMGIYDHENKPKLLVREAFRNLDNPLEQ
ncbi:hypothetical protein JIN77_16595 [Verrucomicrobiaceae bacterium R5-34]|nr:hypothetical protein [Verrucomicrobiaceae bacterium R5-34]